MGALGARGLRCGWREQDDAIWEAARYLGFRRAGRKIQKAFKSAINSAIRAGLLERGGQCFRGILDPCRLISLRMSRRRKAPWLTAISQACSMRSQGWR